MDVYIKFSIVSEKQTKMTVDTRTS